MDLGGDQAAARRPLHALLGRTLGHHGVGQHADAGDLDRDGVAVGQEHLRVAAEAHATRSSSQDHVAGA
jgi:hypothetical protein